jgi:hypothetical protein
MGDTGNQLDRLYSCVFHALYLIVGMIAASFVRAPTLTRAFLLLIVPLNLAAMYHHGDSAALNFPSMTILIIASTAGLWVILPHNYIMFYLQNVKGNKKINIILSLLTLI